MKKIIKFLVLVLIVIQGHAASFAIDDSKVVSDSQKQKELLNSFASSVVK